MTLTLPNETTMADVLREARTLNQYEVDAMSEATSMDDLPAEYRWESVNHPVKG